LTERVTYVPSDDEFSLSRAISTYAKTAADLEKIDAGMDTSGNMVSVIGQIGDALSDVARQLSNPLDEPEPEPESGDGVGA
jgi:hypothetical protein